MAKELGRRKEKKIYPTKNGIKSRKIKGEDEKRKILFFSTHIVLGSRSHAGGSVCSDNAAGWAVSFSKYHVFYFFLLGYLLQ